MSKGKIEINQAAFSRFNSIISSHQSSEGYLVGLLVGKFSASQNSYQVVHALRCPDPNEEDVRSHISDDEVADVSLSLEESAIYESNRKFYVLPNLSHIEESWLASTAVQVNRLLPGGLDIIGVFTTLPQSKLKGCLVKLQKVCLAVHEALEKDIMLPGIDTPNKFLVVCCGEANKDVFFSQLNLSDSNPRLKELSFSIQGQEWVELKSRVGISFIAGVGRAQTAGQLIISSMKNVWSLLSRSMWLFDGQLYDKNMRISSLIKKKTVPVIELAVLLPALPFDGKIADAETEILPAHVTFSSATSCFAYISPNSTIQEAITAMKSDIIRTFQFRVCMHTEDFLLAENDQELDSAHEMARRVVASVAFDSDAQKSIKFSDYMYPGESLKDSLETFVGLLDMQDNLNTTEIIHDIEQQHDQAEIESVLGSLSSDPCDDSEDADGVFGAPRTGGFDAVRSVQLLLSSPLYLIFVLFCTLGISYYFLFWQEGDYSWQPAVVKGNQPWSKEL